jgi:hypothetical protein
MNPKRVGDENLTQTFMPKMGSKDTTILTKAASPAI